MLFLTIFITLFFFILLVFVSRKLSPIPYFPSNKKDVPLIIKALRLRNNQTIIDLGSGSGLVIFAAAREAAKRKLTTRFIAVEINPVLVTIIYLRRFLNPNKKNIKIILADILTMDYSQFLIHNSKFITLFLYVSPWFIGQIVTKAQKELNKFELISYFYEVRGLKGKKIKGKNKIYLYEISP